MLKPEHGGNVWPYINHFRILDFSSNVNPLGPPKEVIEALSSELWRVQYYPDPDCLEFKKIISKALSIPLENVLVCNGSTEAIYLFSSIFLRNRKALIFNPTFEEYEASAKAYGAKSINVNLGPNYNFSVATLREYLSTTPRLSAVFLCNPNNPTGTLLSPGTLLEIMKLTRDFNVMLFIDETFIDFVSDSLRLKPHKYLEYPNVVVAKSLTKSYCLPGLRIGYCIASCEIVKQLEQAKPTWSVSSLAQLAAIEALKSRDYLELSKRIINAERAFLTDELSKINGITVYPSHANFILLKLAQASAEEVKEKLLARGVLVRSCSSFKGLGANYLRIAVRLRWENEALLSLLKKILV